MRKLRIGECRFSVDKNKNICVEYLANFLIGEGKLESYLDKHTHFDTCNNISKTDLEDAKDYLTMVTGDEGKRAGIALDAHLLLAKLYYTLGQYELSLDNFVKAELNMLSEKELTLRSLKILAESYAIKGLCMENYGMKALSKFKQVEKQTEMISCFEKSTDLGLLFFQEQDMVGPEMGCVGTILEVALQRAPIILLKTGKLHEGIERYRLMLNAVEVKATQSLRLNLARQLAEVLYRGVSGTMYKPPTAAVNNLNANPKKWWKPRKYYGKNYFLPKNQNEEILLLLLISESLAVRDAVLSQSSEFRIARLHALGQVTAVYDLLAIETVRWGLFTLLHDTFEKALKFSFCEQHIWRQYSLSLVSLGQHVHAFRALRETTKFASTNSTLNLMSAKLCYEYLGLIKEGINLSRLALQRKSKHLKLSRAQLYVGIGLQQISNVSCLKTERENYCKLALEAFEKAVEYDSNDHLCEYYLALQHAINFNFSEALVRLLCDSVTTDKIIPDAETSGNRVLQRDCAKTLRCALALRAEHAPSLLLFAMLLTANRRPKEALSIVENALEEFPDNLSLLHLKAHLQLHIVDADTALMTVQRMLSIWRKLYELPSTNIDIEFEKYSDTRSLLQLHSSQTSDKDSVYAASLAAVSRADMALSEGASSLSSFSTRPSPQSAWTTQLKIWLLLADIYLSIDLPNEALNCIHEAVQIYPMSHQIMYLRGKIYAYSSQWIDAKQCFLNAVAANPCYTDALRALGETHHMLGEPRLAEKMLRDAAKLDPGCPEIWFSLGKVMETLRDYSAAADCMATALQLEPSCPILSFNFISLTFE